MKKIRRCDHCFYCVGVGPGHFLLQPLLGTWLPKSGSQKRTINVMGEVVKHKNGRCCVRKIHNTLESFQGREDCFEVYRSSRTNFC